MNAASSDSRYALLIVSRNGSGPAMHTLEEAAQIVSIHPERLRHYCRRGVFGPGLARAEGEPVFDDDRLYELRRFEHFRQHHRVNLCTLRLLCDLWREVEKLRNELRFIRNP